MSRALKRLNQKAAAKRLLVERNPELPRGNSNPRAVCWHVVDLRHGLAYQAHSLADAEEFIDARCMEAVP